MYQRYKDAFKITEEGDFQLLLKNLSDIFTTKWDDKVIGSIKEYMRIAVEEKLIPRVPDEFFSTHLFTRPTDLRSTRPSLTDRFCLRIASFISSAGKKRRYCAERRNDVLKLSRPGRSWSPSAEVGGRWNVKTPH